MIRRILFSGSFLLFLAGCGEKYQPTVRQSSSPPQDATATDTAQEARVDDAHPSVSHAKRTKRDGSRAKIPDAVHANAEGGSHAKAAKSPLTKSSQTNPLKATNAEPAEVGAKGAETATAASAEPSPTKTADAGPAKTADPVLPAPASRDAALLNSREVRIGDMQLTAPKDWARIKPPIKFILAQFNLPKASGDPIDGQLTVAAIGENSPKNLERFRKQMGESQKGSVETMQIAGSDVILLDNSGSYGEIQGPFAPPVKEGRYRVFNAIVPLGNKLYFVTCTGPEKTIGDHSDEFRSFLLSMKSVKN